MTLRDFFQLITDNPFCILFFFLALPLTAFLAGIFGKGEGHISPWKYLYSTLVYLSVVPGIFAASLNIYLFLFERQSIFDADLYTQILPIISMIITLWLIRRNVNFDEIPGFDKLTGLFLLISILIILMWISDRTYFIVFTGLPLYAVLLIFIGILILIRFAWHRMIRKDPGTSDGI